jgi:hypothetical protein
MQAVRLVDTRTTEERLPGLFSVGVKVENGDRGAISRRVGGSSRKGFIGKKGEAIVVRDETASYTISSFHGQNK